MRRGIVVVVGALALAPVGCGSDDEAETPPACLQGATTYLSALEDAPDEVRLDGETPISECLADDQPAGALATVGEAIVETATTLAREARRDPGGDAALRLGYLVGAVERGAAETSGIHADLVRRVTSAAGSVAAGGEPPPGFERAFERGRAAGAARG